MLPTICAPQGYCKSPSSRHKSRTAGLSTTSQTVMLVTAKQGLSKPSHNLKSVCACPSQLTSQITNSIIYGSTLRATLQS
ncbi:hypothetical protein O6P43_032372 [Quillaja saponaria]|uniref:Uncharacterized protein n=1 Tax=Quillaja saponaria TaxID=32244 RepID=A0AAD7KNI9_QUISA|nr:hypothetical protein O6P43_032372 [Quillaja saponaria]